MGNQGGVYTWSKTAANNATFDNTVNWSEGQSPSSINDSARAMMASTAKWRDDISGSIVTTGTSTAYIVSSNQDFDSKTDFDGQLIAFTPHATNGAGPVTMTVDGMANLPLRSSPSQELTAGVLVEGTPYIARFSNTDGALYLQSFFGNTSMPIGAGTDFWGSSLPNSSYAFPFGQQVSQTTYAALYTVFGPNKYGADGGGLFFLPDKRGRVSVGQDNMGGTAAGRVTTAGSGIDGTTAGAPGGVEVVTQQRSDLPNVSMPLVGTAGTATASGLNLLPNEGNEAVGGSGNAPAARGDGTAVNTINSSFTPAGNTFLNGNETQTAMNNMPPAIVVPYIIRII